MSNNSFPERFRERLRLILGKKSIETEEQAFFDPLPRSFRLLKGEIPEKTNTKPVQNVPNAYLLQERAELPLGKNWNHITGGMYIQSLSSMIPPLVLNAEEDAKILDMCAAPGSKTLQLSHMVGENGLVVANEISSSRSKKLVANLLRCGATNVAITHSDATKMPHWLGQEFDYILLDAPCSSEGYSRRSANYAKNWNERFIHETAQLQKGLIIAAFRMLAAGGEMVYSTCTTAPEENEAIVTFLVNKFPDQVEILPVELPKNIPTTAGITNFEGKKYPPEVSQNVKRFFPHLKNENWDSEAFFIAKIRKKAGISQKPPEKSLTSDPGVRLKKNARAEVITRWKKYFGLPSNWAGKQEIIKKNGDLWLVGKRAWAFSVKNRTKRIGMPAFDKFGVPTTAFAWKLGHLASQNTLQLDELTAKKWQNGENLPLEPETYQDGHILLIKYKDFCLGVGKVFKNGKYVKNRLEKELRMQI